jgi:biopolymer transport protein ExbD
MPMSFETLAGIIDYRRKRYNVFPIMIRADYLTKHSHVKRVMDICTNMGIGRVSFVAIKETKTKI